MRMYYDNDMHSLFVKSVAMETAAKPLEISWWIVNMTGRDLMMVSKEATQEG